MTRVHTVSSLSDRDLVTALQRLVATGRQLDAELLRFIAEVDRRKLYREHACSSMFAYCTERLGMSEDAAYKRIRVARAARTLPIMLERLETGAIHLSGLALLAAHVTTENAESVLARAAGKTKREIEVLVRELSPLPDVAPSIRKVTARTSPLSHPPSQLVSGPAEPAPAIQLAPGPAEQAPAPPAPAPAMPPEKPARIAPLAPARYHLSFTASEALKKNIDRARELVGRGTAVESLFEEAMTDFVAKLENRRLGAGVRRGPAKAASDTRKKSRYIPKDIRREVYERDGGQCTYVDANGHRCSERHGLHFDHIRPHALGGPVSAENLRLRCGPHDLLHAEECFGPLFVKRAMASPSVSRSP